MRYHSPFWMGLQLDNIGLVVPVFSATIALNLLTALLVVATGVRAKNPLSFYAVVILCCTVALNQYALLHFHTATDINSAIYWIRFHSDMLYVCIPAVYFAFSQWARRSDTLVWTFSLAFISGAIIVINHLLPYGLRFSSVQGLVQRTMFNGEAISLIQGEVSVANHLLHLYVLSVLVILLFKIRNVTRINVYQPASLLRLVIALLMISAYLSWSTDNNNLAFFYSGGIVLTLMNILICLNIASSVHKQGAKLKLQTAKRKKLTAAMFNMAESVSRSGSDNFYHQATESVMLVSEADLVVSAKLPERNGQPAITTLSYRTPQGVEQNRQLPLLHSPFEQIISNGLTVYHHDVADAFPNYAWLDEIQASGFIGLPLSDAEGNTLGILVVISKTTKVPSPELLNTLQIFASRTGAEIERLNLLVRLQKMAFYDYATNLPNLAWLQQEIPQILSHCQQEGNQAMLILISIDRFTDIYRRLGFELTDKVVDTVVERLVRYLTENESVSRVSNNQFAVLTANVDNDNLNMAERHLKLLYGLLSDPVILGNREIRLDIKMGAVMFPAQADSPHDVMRCAESALQQARTHFHSPTFLFDPDIQARLDKQYKIEQALEQALKSNDQLYLVYQPKVRSDGSIVGAEVLMRWQHPEMGFIPPSEFIPVAEESGLIHPLGEWLFEQVFTQIEQWQQQGLFMPGRVAINVAAPQFSRADFYHQLIAKMKRYKMDPRQIELEMTESGLLDNLDFTVSMLARLRAIGISIAIDDFGTGYSSLSQLQSLPLDVLKVDKSFIDELNQPKTYRLVNTILSISQNMELETIAEGTETAEQVEQLESLGCHQFQGFYFSKPLPADEFTAWLTSQVADVSVNVHPPAQRLQ